MSIRLLIKGISSKGVACGNLHPSGVSLFKRPDAGIILVCFLALSTSLQAQLAYQEDFNYSGTLSSHGWIPFSNTGNSPINAVATGLFYAGYFNSGGVNAVTFISGSNWEGDEHVAAAD